MDPEGHDPTTFRLSYGSVQSGKPDDTVAKIKKQFRIHNSPTRILHFANSARTARPTPNRIVGKPPTTSGPTAEEKCPEISIQFSCKKLFIPTVAERRRRRHPPGGKLGESRRLASKTPHGQARAAFSTAQPRPFFFPIFRKAGATVRFGCVADSAGVELCGARQDSGPPRAEAAARAALRRCNVATECAGFSKA